MTLHEQCEAARKVGCNCGAPPGRPCVNCAPGDYHVARFTHTRRAGFIGIDDMARVIRTSLRIVHDPEVTA